MRKIILGAVAIAVVFTGAMIAFLMQGQTDGKNLTVGVVDMAQLQDGMYIGSYEGGRWSNRVQVTVEAGQLTHIHVLEDVMFQREEVREELLEAMLQAQSLDVDGRSGATITVNAYRKAIEDALRQAR